MSSVFSRRQSSALSRGSVELFFAGRDSIHRNARCGDVRFRRASFQKREDLLRRIAMPFIIRFADQIIAVSDRTRRDLIEIFHVDPNKVSVIHEGASEHLVHKPSQCEIDETLRKFKIKCNFILFVGEISERKNIGLLLAAFRDFVTVEGLQIQLVLA